ncbi:WD repeat-containing protein 75-like [Mizuhopecten yessoensis]|uniref:WD repeat-containing protein 75 n=1 Tax=Mizuhopecten yessoensis TaxID=6573 RepID=A0A210PH19_MIZYE|nr:WD repeat-containing protein 75-like [Mizuhopecten yessoensis]OWF35767.1 WD repeat-containing protein 75 [Mizuhopecten yessoensis]
MSASTENVDEKKIIASVRAGANLTRSKPLFSYDSKFLFCCAESLVKVYSTISGECVHNLKGHKNTTTGLVINSQNKLQLLSCSLDQTVIFWDYSDGVLLKRIRLQGPLHGIWIRPGDPDLVQVLKHFGNSYYLEHCNMLTSNKDESKSIKDLSGLSSDPRSSAIGCKGKYLAAVKGCFLYVKSTSKSSKIRRFTFPDFTCVACHPTDFCIATGTGSGKIILWWSFLGDQSHVVKSTLHWHALPVLDLTFTVEGSYLLSGGHECVLVKWQYNSEYRDFRPRLGAPLTHVAISPDNLLYATSHDDNAIQLLTSNFLLTQVYQGLTKTNLSAKQTCLYPAGLNFDPRSKALVLNGKPGHLQFYSVHSDKQLYNLDIVRQNYISSENIQRPLDVTEVIQSEFNSTGDWLATVEYWNNGVMTPEMRLKFWKYNTETQSYTLNTTVEVPHDKVIKCLRFRPDTFTDNNEDPMVVTTSEDGKFKIWSNMDDTNIYRTNTRWNCDSVGYFHDKPAGRCAFTADGSLLGVVFGASITLWDPDNNVLRETLNSQQGTVQFIEFGKKSCSHYLATTTVSNVTVWDLITCAVVWSASIESTHLVADPLSDVMAVFGKNKSLFVFKPSDPNYLYCNKNIRKDAEGAVFIPHQKKSSKNEGGQLSWQCESQLYWMTNKQDLMTLTVEEDEPTHTQLIPIKTNLPQTPFSALLTAERKKGFQPSAYRELESEVYTTASQFTSQLLETASHVQAPVTSLCNTFIHALLIREKSHSSAQLIKDEDDNDASDEEEKVTTNSDSESDMEVEDKEVSISKTDTSSKGKQDRQKKDIVTEQKSFEMPNLDWYSTGLNT